MILTREKGLLDYTYSYWQCLSYHLEKELEALSFQQLWKAYEIITSNDNPGKNPWALEKTVSSQKGYPNEEDILYLIGGCFNRSQRSNMNSLRKTHIT
jgi:hypothetical protein